MAQEPENGRNASGIARAGKRKWGYDPAQVDAFLERAHKLYDSEGVQLTQQDIQNVSFDLRRNGYVIGQVDAALARLERAVVDRQTTWEITRNGRVAWKAQTEELYRSIARHASRAARERFRDGAPKAPSYDRKQVDRLVDQIVDKAAAELGLDGVTEADVRKLVDLNASSVANVIFTQRKGRRGYDERQVDYFLNACVRLLSRIESYARVADYVGEETASAPANPAPVASLFPETQPAATAPTSFAPEPASDDFDALSKAEQAIFTAPVPAATHAASPVLPSPEPPAAPEPAMPPSFAPASVPKPPAAKTFDAAETASWTPDFATEPAPAAAPTPAAPAAAPVPAAPAPATPAPEPPAAGDAPASGDSSLAALAQMAESVRPAAQPDAKPLVPDLQMPSVPSLGPIDIPDLSFPSFDFDTSTTKKTEE